MILLYGSAGGRHAAEVPYHPCLDYHEMIKTVHFTHLYKNNVKLNRLYAMTPEVCLLLRWASRFIMSSICNLHIHPLYIVIGISSHQQSLHYQCTYQFLIFEATEIRDTHPDWTNPELFPHHCQTYTGCLITTLLSPHLLVKIFDL
jgi:hypothetical protein